MTGCEYRAHGRSHGQLRHPDFILKLSAELTETGTVWELRVHLDLLDVLFRFRVCF